MLPHVAILSLLDVSDMEFLSNPFVQPPVPATSQIKRFMLLGLTHVFLLNQIAVGGACYLTCFSSVIF